jgi:CubicO group peptidase (beta-lactamase class C family)
MGCWAFGIYQSDDSMDWESELYEAAGLDKYDDDFDPTAPAVRAGFESALPRMLEELAAKSETTTPRSGFYKAVGYQMLACLLMRHGCAMTAALRQQVIDGILACPEYRLAKDLLAHSGGTAFSVALLKEAGVETGVRGYAGVINRWQGRMGALERLAKELGEYDIAGGTPHDYQDKGSLELYGEPEKESAATGA